MKTVKTCEKCGKSFACSSNSDCWCGAVKKSEDILARLKQQFVDCLCADCLAEAGS